MQCSLKLHKFVSCLLQHSLHYLVNGIIFLFLMQRAGSDVRFGTRKLNELEKCISELQISISHCETFVNMFLMLVWKGMLEIS